MTILFPPSCSFEPQNISVETFKNLPCGRSFPLSCQLMLPGRGKQEINLKVPFLHLLIFISIGNDTVFFSQTQCSFQRNLMMLWIDWLSHTCTYMHTYINMKKNKKEIKKLCQNLQVLNIHRKLRATPIAWVFRIQPCFPNFVTVLLTLSKNYESKTS